MILIGIDPGLQRTGWGVIRQQGNALSFVACGVIKSESRESRVESRVKKNASVKAMSSKDYSLLDSRLSTLDSSSLPSRLLQLSTELARVIALYRPAEAAVEEIFVNVNGASTLKLGQARGAILLTLAQAGLPIAEYAALLVKKTVAAAGRAEKPQVARMVQILLPGCGEYGADAMDALAVAICHSQHATMRRLTHAG